LLFKTQKSTNHTADSLLLAASALGARMLISAAINF
jgi:hypothetical protein